MLGYIIMGVVLVAATFLVAAIAMLVFMSFLFHSPFGEVAPEMIKIYKDALKEGEKNITKKEV